MIGLVGKLPAHGDFVRRGGPVSILAAIDLWLDVELSRSADVDAAIAGLDDWRFAIRVGDDQVCGAMVASTDAVGRRFPLIAILADRDDLQAARPWTEEAATALAAVRDAALRADDAMHRLTAIEPPATSAGQGPAAGWWRPDGTCVLADPVLPAGERFTRLIAGAHR